MTAPVRARWRRTFATALLATALAGAGAVGAAPEAPAAPPARLIVKLRPGASLEGAEMSRVHAQAGVRAMRPLHAGRPRGRLRADPAERVFVLDVPAGADVEALAEAYRRDPACEYAQPDRLLQAHFTPNDPFFATSGAWGQAERDLWALERMGAESAWDATLGEGILVAVVDSGVDYDHPDLAANVWINPGEDLDANGRVDPADRNGVDDDANGFADDFHGYDFVNGDGDPFDDHFHGTHVAGSIAAVGDNASGVIGVAPAVRVLAAKGLGSNGIGTTSALAQAIVYAAEQGARVINNSWGCQVACPSQPALEDAVRTARGLGAVVVFSAGNSRSDVALFSPQNTGDAIVVAASTPDDRVAAFSSFGFTVDVAAPGGGTGQPSPQNVLSLRSGARGDPALVVAERYLRLAGTSMSAAYVSGVAALVLARHPELDAEQVRTALRASALDIGPPGADLASGAGRVSAAAALALDGAPDVRAALVSPAAGQLFSQTLGELPLVGTAAGAELARYELFWGAGRTPENWHPIGAGTGPVEDGTLATWDLRGVPDGAVLLRLRAIALNGAALESLLPVALELRAPRTLSGGPFEGFDPSVSGDLVGWWEHITLLRARSFFHDLATGQRIPLSPGAQFVRSPDISGANLVWSQFPATGLEVFLCRYERGARSCPAQQITDTLFSVADLPHVSGERIVWNGPKDGVNSGGSAIFTCLRDPASGACPQVRVSFEAGDQFPATVDGERIVWINVLELGGTELSVCDFDAATGTCPAHRLAEGAPSDPSVSGDRIVWADERGVLLCVYDAASGACADLLVLSASGVDPAISGDRVVWADSAGQGPGVRQILHCQHDRDRRSCTPRALGHSAVGRISPDIDGARVAFGEAIDGLQAIHVVDLARVLPIGDRRVRAREELSVEVAAEDPLGVPPALRVEAADGSPLASLGARFEDRGDGTGLLVWKPSAAQVGSHRLKVFATDLSGTDTFEQVRIEVAAPNRRPIAEAGPLRIVRDSKHVRLDGCRSRDPDGDALSYRWLDRRGRLVGAECAVVVQPPRRASLHVYELRVSDGVATDRDITAVLRRGRGH